MLVSRFARGDLLCFAVDKPFRLRSCLILPCAEGVTDTAGSQRSPRPGCRDKSTTHVCNVEAARKVAGFAAAAGRGGPGVEADAECASETGGV